MIYLNFFLNLVLYYHVFVLLQAVDIHNEFMKAIDACNVKFDAAKVFISN